MSEFKPIHRANDEYGELTVLDDGQYRVLAFGDNDEQSKLDKASPHLPQHTYIQAMLAALLFNTPKSAIILGLGGGALVHALKHYDSAIKMTAVELRAPVIEAAKRFFQLPIGKKLKLVNQDALEFIASAEHKKVDIIFADIYSEQGVDGQQVSSAFFEQCQAKLKQGGLLVLNCWKEHSKDDALKQRLQSQFNHVYACLTGSGNWVIFASQVDCNFNLANNKAALQELSQQLDFNIARVLTRFDEWV
ncbi:methyltransferase [Shewanella sp. WXL01]|uniref:spermidine synthase n=1 Tax=Shewanella sp. WXL01 TaxID=2709721 RepID=UPI0014385AA2|nr:fused MFS/spermidine synthase [Shewanella sp. WXL01]NKF49261.1 methyltransferase [Shewanella sp. WXL01]